MRTFLPPPTDNGLSDGWGLRRAVRLAGPGPAALADDPVHTERLRVYLADLLRPYGLGLAPGEPGHGGQSYGEMAEALIRLAVPTGESVDLLVLAYSVPDITPGRATTTHLSHVCPGGPMAFAVSDQGSAGAFTALRLIQAYARAGELRNALLLVVEQAALPYDPGVPVALPDGHYGVALLFGEQRPGERTVRLGQVGTRTLPAEDAEAALAAELGGDIGGLNDGSAPVTALLAATLAAQAPALDAVKRLKVADGGRPGTGVWWELVGDLADPLAEPHHLVLADYDAGSRSLSLAALATRADIDVTGQPR